MFGGINRFQQLVIPIITNTGRQQHFHQTIKYLMDTAVKVLQKLKTKALDIIDQTTRLLTPPTTSNKLHNTQFISGTIQVSKHPIDHIKEQTLQNDPIIKLKKNILVASQEQLQQVTKQTKQSLQKQIVKKDNKWEL